GATIAESPSDCDLQQVFLVFSGCHSNSIRKVAGVGVENDVIQLESRESSSVICVLLCYLAIGSVLERQGRGCW
ncbi:hypothetical protein PFISCL1PPCAC_5827, partial [Pristionchus fissidentatus]